MRILGMSPLHDSSVAIIHNGQVEYFSKEERLTRKKRDMCPYLSFDNALKYSKGKIDYVVISSPTKDDILNDQLEVYIKKKLDDLVDKIRKYFIGSNKLESKDKNNKKMVPKPNAIFKIKESDFVKLYNGYRNTAIEYVLKGILKLEGSYPLMLKFYQFFLTKYVKDPSNDMNW